MNEFKRIVFHWENCERASNKKARKKPSFYHGWVSKYRE